MCTEGCTVLVGTLFNVRDSFELFKKNYVHRDYAEKVLINRKTKGHVCLVAGYISLICDNTVTTQHCHNTTLSQHNTVTTQHCHNTTLS
jgi:hypothetical protein